MATATAPKDRTRPNQFREVFDSGRQLLEAARQQALSPSNKKPGITYTIGQVAELIGRTTKTIRDAEPDTFKPRRIKTGSVERRIYTHEDVLYLMEHFGRRPKLSRAVTITVAGYKGGSSKSTTAAHIAHYLARQGYRVLAIDFDSQATLTQQLIGVIPDLDILPYMTLAPCLSGEQPLIDPINQLHPTNWPNLQVVPASLALLDADLALRARVSEDPSLSAIEVIEQALERVRDQFDVIVCDTPPTLNYLSINPVAMADLLLTPVPPRIADVASTVAYFGMMSRLAEEIDLYIPAISVLPTMVSHASETNERDSVEDEIGQLMRYMFRHWIMEHEVLASKAIPNAASEWRTLYEVEHHDQVWRRAMKSMDATCQEIENKLKALNRAGEEG